MKLGIAYNLFDGEELLEYSIKSIRDNVDFISVIYQEVSYHGNKCSEDILEFLITLKDRGLIDEVHLFKPNLGLNPSINETNKRNIGLHISRKNDCTHHMSIDTDEFYTDEQFKFMKDTMLNGDYDSGACQHCQYYKDSIYMIKDKENEYVTTIEKIHDFTQYVFAINYPVIVDPTRKTNNIKYKIFNRFEVEMHHMSYVRKDIKKKLLNSSARVNMTPNQIDIITDTYNNWVYPELAVWGNLKKEVIEIPRIFEIY